MDNNKIPSKSLAEIFKDYPRFLDMPALMDIEFSKLTDRNEDLFIQKREGTIIPELKEIASWRRKLTSDSY